MLTMNYLLKSLPSIFVFIKYYKIGFSLNIYLLQIILCQENLLKKKKKNLNKVFKALFVLNFVNK